MSSAAAVLFDATSTPHRGTVVVAHGLNNKPEAMDQLIEHLRESGFHCARTTFSHATGRVPATVICRNWLADLEKAHRQARSAWPGLPVYSLSYSLGCLVTLHFLRCSQQPSFRKIVLLAPPLVLTRPASLIRYVGALSRLGLSLPSFAPARVRARSQVPLSEYAAMLMLSDGIRQGDINAYRVPARVVLSATDKLVDYRRVREWVVDKGLDNWTVNAVTADALSSNRCAHLMFLREAVGLSAWSALTQSITEHFE